MSSLVQNLRLRAVDGHVVGGWVVGGWVVGGQVLKFVRTHVIQEDPGDEGEFRLKCEGRHPQNTEQLTSLDLGAGEGNLSRGQCCWTVGQENRK